MFTGTLIEDLMSTVERVELRTQADAELMAESEPRFASLHQNAGSGQELLGPEG